VSAERGTGALHEAGQRAQVYPGGIVRHPRRRARSGGVPGSGPVRSPAKAGLSLPAEKKTARGKLAERGSPPAPVSISGAGHRELPDIYLSHGLAQCLGNLAAVTALRVPAVCCTWHE